MPNARVESLEGRRHFAATVGLDSTFGTVVTPVAGSNAFASQALPLSDGRVLVYGQTYSETNFQGYGAVFALYDARGRLDKSFDHDGTLVLDAKTAGRLFGYVDRLQRLSDDGVLVSTEFGVRRIDLDGTLDTAFGNGGVLPKHASNPVILPDGTIRAQQITGTIATQNFKTRLLTFDARGRYLAETPFVEAPGLTRLDDGRYAAVIKNDRLAIYDDKLQPDPAFGTNGSAYIAAYGRRWAAKHGPWYELAYTTQPVQPTTVTWTLTQTPKVIATQFVQTDDGGFQVGFVVRAAHAPTTTGARAVVRSLHLTAAGGIVDAVMPYQTLYHDAGFMPAAWGTFGGTFRFKTGGDVTVTADVGNESGGLLSTSGAVAAGDGSYYLFGRINNGIGVVRTAPVAGVISGTAFGDTNNNGKSDANESPAVGKVVYLDLNNNGRRDDDERWTTTDTAGHYAFDELGPGRYVVRRVLPKGYTVTQITRPHTLNAGQALTLSIGTKAA